ncbi:polyketide synthase [Aspergillus keveii]|uniref:Polyketide synthase n=1 Tax=Aspergillus keveii TaxID=714993 RepID=A0ABR4G403_9EURO
MPSKEPEDILTPLAIVGLSFKFPQDATSPEGFWDILEAGRCTSTEFPASRMNIDAHYHPDRSRLDAMSVRGGHFMKEDLGAFDAPFFGMSVAEAQAMDPQQRLALETVYRAFENSGLSLADVAGSRTSVVAGSFCDDYHLLQVKDPLEVSAQGVNGSARTMISNRVSWFFDLRGPSLTLDTACSSSLVAMDMVCQSIWGGDAKMGVAIGSNIIIAPEMTIGLDNLGLLSPDSRSYSFDDRANGYARGEGVGAIVIRPLPDAIENGDTIRAVIRSSSCNQDGKTPGIFQPSKDAQARLILDTYAKAGLDMAMTRYFEAHGTGTAVGDPIETRAIGTTFRKYRSKDEPLYVGSVKSNIGHLEGASGIAGVIKVILALEKGVIPPNSENLQNLNPQIDEEFYNLKFPTSLIPWPTNGLRRASVSSFGFGGANCHIVLDDAYNFLRLRGIEGEYHQTAVAPPLLDGNTTVANGRTDHGESGAEKYPQLLVWSSADEGGIKRMQDVWRKYLSGTTGLKSRTKEFVDSLAYTLAARRSHLMWRTFAVANRSEGLQGIADIFHTAVRSKTPTNLAYVFTGQGAQWPAMGRELIDRYEVFRHSLADAGSYLKELGCAWDLLDELHKPMPDSNVDDPSFGQPLCTALQLALVDLLSSWNVIPAAVIGHSSGEIAAAYSAGALSKHSALKVAYFRGCLAGHLSKNSQTKGAMLAVGLSQTDVQPYLKTVSTAYGSLRLVIGCVNSPKNITISGETQQIEHLDRLLTEDGIFSRKLAVNVAYHSFQMEEVASEYESLLGDLEPPCPRTKRHPIMISSVTGDVIHRDDLANPAYWVRNMVSPVLFSNALGGLCQQLPRQTKKIDGSHRRAVRVDQLLEIGPHSALQSPCRDILRAGNVDKKIKYIASLRRNHSDTESLLECVGQLHCEGHPINVSLVNASRSTRQGRVLTDLPEYPFNHDTSYWHESRRSKNFRFRDTGRLDLLGIKDVDSNPMEAHWRNIISAENLPWVEDHKVNNEILYPAAGMVVMAVEAIKQLVDVDRRVSGFSVKDCKFLSPIRIATTHAQRIETSLHMKRAKLGKSDSTGWYDFRLCFWDREAWTESCTGSIQASFEPGEAGMTSNDDEDAKWQAHLARNYEEIARRCTNSIDPVQFYDSLIPNGYNYGPAFAAITGLRTNAVNYKELVSTIRTFQGSSSDGSKIIQPHTIHPTTLDAIIHTMTAMTVRTGAQRKVVAIPTSIKELWISNSGNLSYPGADTLEVYACSEGRTVTQSQYAMAVFDKDVEHPLLTLDGLGVAEVDNAVARDDEDAWAIADLCHHVDWKPDVDLFGPKEVDTFFPKVGVEGTDTIELCQKIELLVSIYISRVPKSLLEQAKAMSHSHMHRYIDWLEKQQEAIHARQSSSPSLDLKAYMEDDELLCELHDELDRSSKRARLASIVAKNLTKFISGDADPIRLYSSPKVDQIASTDSETGGMRVPRYSKWDFTDISSSFFAQAQSQFAGFDRVRFMPLDIEKDPEVQGFECGTYDLVAAYLVFHATVDLSVSLKNARKLLKPGGRLLFIEITKPGALVTDLTFGLFEGWWRGSESYRTAGPCIDEVKWDELLHNNGFSGCDIVAHDFDDERLYETSAIISTAVDDSQPRNQMAVEIILDSQSQTQTQLASAISESLFKAGIDQVRHVPMSADVGTELSPEAFQVSLLEVEHPLLYRMDCNDFQHLHDLISNTKSLLWVNGGGGTQPCPKFRLCDGLLRAVGEEDQESRLCVLSLEQSSCVNHQAEKILKVLQSRMQESDRGADTEFTEIGGLLHVGRLVNATSINREVALKKSAQHELVRDFGAEPALSLHIGSPGLLNTLHFAEDSSLQKPLGPNEIEIRVRAVGLNFLDVLIALGRLNSQSLGFEFAGEVVRVGHACVKFHLGDRVVAYHPSKFANYVRIREDMAVMKVPDNGLSFEETAAIPIVYGTAWLTLNHTARLQPGESVLIHSGAGGTGQAAIQIAHYLGATVFTTVSSSAKKQFLMQEYNIPEERIFSSRNTLFAKGIRRLTGGRGVDVVLNSLSSDQLVASWECVAPYGRFVEIGKNDIITNSKLSMAQFLKNVSFHGVDLSTMAEDHPQLLLTALQEIFALIDVGKLSPKSVEIYGISEIEQAFRHMQSGRNIGKTVLSMRPTDQVKAMVDTKPTCSFDKDSTYVIAGGLGGLGRSIAHWLVDRGARNLILLSRSGSQNVYAGVTTKDLQEKGATVLTPACDITDRAGLASTLESCSWTMPPIKGCIQASMVVSSSHFGALTYDSWLANTGPKAQGSWNLHELLPQGLDFFVLLSSVAGIMGARGDSGYAAGNTFLDGLARYRNGIGEKAVSLDLGLFLSAGYLHENERVREYFLSNNVLRPLRESDLHALLDIYCSHSVEALSTEKSQTVVGITPVVRQKGTGRTDWLQKPIASHINIAGLGSSSASKGGKTNFAEVFASGKSLEEVSCAIAQSMKAKLAQMLSISPGELDLDKPIHQYGVDSLTAVELRNWFSREMRADVAIFDILGGASISSVVTLAVGKSEYCLPNNVK